jgi:hypothetical protein
MERATRAGRTRRKYRFDTVVTNTRAGARNPRQKGSTVLLLFHGTTGTVARIALKEGLKPRAATGRSNYTAASHPDAVYLTDAYAPYFAHNTRDTEFKHGAGVVVVDTDKLSFINFAADEDTLEQVTRSDKGELSNLAREKKANIAKLSIWRRTEWFKSRQFEFVPHGANWQWSLRALGTCCYHGTITPDAIVKVIVWDDVDTAAELVLSSFDPSITIVNYNIAGARYRFLMQEFARVDTGHKLSDFDKMALGGEPGVAYRRELFSRTTHIDNAEYRK